jgi:putative membrane protein
MGLKSLHPGAKWLFRVNGFFRILFGVVFLSIFLFSFLIPLMGSNLENAFSIFALVIIFAIIILFVFIEIYARLSYKFWKYEFTGEQLRIESGIIWKRYSNIPYQRIQNVDITRGIIARLCGFSTVNIQTAGYSAVGNGARMSTEGYIPAVSIEEAEKIREFVIKKIGKRKGQGL